MKVILLQDVAKIGRKHAVVNVPDGYGQNQLIPKGLAKPATPDNLKLVERLAAEKGAKESAAEAKFFAVKKALEGRTVVISGKKHDHGHLFATIKPEDVVTAAAEIGIAIEKNWIKLPNPIKTTGEHRIELTHSSHSNELIIKIE